MKRVLRRDEQAYGLVVQHLGEGNAAAFADHRRSFEHVDFEARLYRVEAIWYRTLVFSNRILHDGLSCGVDGLTALHWICFVRMLRVIHG